MGEKLRGIAFLGGGGGGGGGGGEAEGKCVHALNRLEVFQGSVR